MRGGRRRRPGTPNQLQVGQRRVCEREKSACATEFRRDGQICVRNGLPTSPIANAVVVIVDRTRSVGPQRLLTVVNTIQRMASSSGRRVGCNTTAQTMSFIGGLY